ncbi:uncharacterized protein LOC123441647 [Hordeum vulgare subsp. vulgare]|uniref:uncharacterized protein LOC123441647 n=1 Tax=Hordeum vulgare subsp. vulgare TaxID=112509 RepID=UPI001D1A3FBC|nr:uncharacterized protein LOC123441647 [Hordeum vulgare subsp. vulgare]
MQLGVFRPRPPHDLQLEHLLVFRHEDKAVLTVKVFDGAMCRRHYRHDCDARNWSSSGDDKEQSGEEEEQSRDDEERSGEDEEPSGEEEEHSARGGGGGEGGGAYSG